MNEWTIGSAPGNDILVSQPMVSGRHCRLTKTPNGLLLTDLGSTNGTFVNGERITDARLVTPTDKITLGLTTPLPWPPEALGTAATNDSGQTASPRRNLKWVALLVVLLLTLAGGTAYVMRDKLQKQVVSEAVPKDNDGEDATVDPEATTEQGLSEFVDLNPVEGPPKLGFQMGTFQPDEWIESIDVKLFVGFDGADLDEPIDLHLGLGFPLRLYPVGSEDRNPAFAAFPQTTTVPDGETSIAAGTMAVFRFSSRATDEGLDVLRTTPPLLADVRYADIQKIGFSSRGESAWILAGYQIDINGKLFASNDSLELSVLEEQEEKAAELATLLSDAEPLALQIIEGEAFERASLADAADKVALAEVKQKFAELEPAILRLRGMTEGFYPWFEEADELFTPAAVAGEKISSVRIQLLTGTESSAGSGNSIYLKAGGHKYLLSSATDPLDSVNKLQEFTIASDVFDFDPLRTADLLPEKIGIGMLGSDQAFDRIPDRANIQRVILEADDAVVYDSEKNGADRATLAAISLIPPVHRDNVGFPVENRTTPYEVYLWKPGMPLPDAERKPQLAEMDKPAPKENLDTPENQNLPKAPLLGINPQPRPPVRPLFGPLNSRRRPPTPIIVINFPIVFGGVPPNTPGPTRPVISDVKIVPGNNPVQFGQSSRVSWTVKGNRSQVSRFRVRLYPVLPHRTGTIIRPVADTTSTNSGSRQVTLTPTQTLLSATGISARESQVMFVRPEVTALNSLGQVINGTAATGPILPIFPAGGTPVRLHHASPPPATPPWPVNGTTVFAPAFPSNGPGTRFAIFNGTSFPFSGTITPSDPGSGSAVWRLGGSQFSQGSVFDSYPFSGLGQWAHNTAIRPGAAPLTTLATQYVVFGVPVPQRLVAHVGFIGDRPSWTNRAHVDVDIRVIDFLTPALSRWVRTTTPVVCSKTNNRLTLIDIPIAPGPAQVGQLVPGNAAAPPAGLTGGVPMDFAYLVPAQPDYPAITVGSGVNAIAITISSRQDRVLFNTVTGERQSVGVFGLRLIP